MIDRIRIQRKPSVGHTLIAPASSPCEIEVHIEELVLHGFDPRARWNVGDALESELRGLLAARGVPALWQMNPEKPDAGAIPLRKPAGTGKQVAAAVYRGGDR
jgi:hypothetical protein